MVTESKSVVYMPFRYKKFDSKYLLTNDHFNYVWVTEDEFEKVKGKDVDAGSELFTRLVDSDMILKSSEQTDSVVSRSKDYMNKLFVGPSLHIVVMTKRCNQTCGYCHASALNSNKEEFDLSLKNAKRYTELIMNSPNPNITIEFQGGEPLLNYDMIKYIIEYANELNKTKKKDLRFSIVSNMEIMDDEKFDYLISKKVGLCTSIDGPKVLHDHNRPSWKSKSSHDIATGWIKKANERGIYVGALTTISKKSISMPKEIVDEFVRLGLKSLHLRELNFIGRATGTWNKISYTAEEFIEFWKTAADYIIELNKKGIYIEERRLKIILEKVLNKYEPGYLDMTTPCGAVIGQISYNYDGNIFTCDEGRLIGEEIFRVGNAESKSIKEIMASEKTMQLLSTTINDTYYCDQCVYKAYCGVCPACNYAQTGNLITDVLRTSRCKINMATFDYVFQKLNDPEARKVLERWVSPEKRLKIKTCI
ncbi:His-Xaa-Ser system radical SAM maturase HxsB [Candidatus Woesearchaeota archaeon]|nr:His-Xaa-Ser system radical SAM maturase HxsB [Candidatus Woesearchaeota archaeon]